MTIISVYIKANLFGGPECHVLIYIDIQLLNFLPYTADFTSLYTDNQMYTLLKIEFTHFH